MAPATELRWRYSSVRPLPHVDSFHNWYFSAPGRIVLLQIVQAAAGSAISPHIKLTLNVMQTNYECYESHELWILMTSARPSYALPVIAFSYGETRNRSTLIDYSSVESSNRNRRKATHCVHVNWSFRVHTLQLHAYIPGEHALLTSAAGRKRTNSAKVWRAKIPASASCMLLLATLRTNVFIDKAASHSALASTWRGEEEQGRMEEHKRRIWKPHKRKQGS